MTAPETASSQEMVNVSLGDVHRLFFIAQRFRDVLSSDLLFDLGLYPTCEDDGQCSVLYTSLFAESEARVIHEMRNIDFTALIPIDVNKIEPSAKKPIALPRRLTEESLETEVNHFLKGESSDLAAANLTQVLSNNNEPTIVLLENLPNESHRKFSILRTTRVDEFVKDVLNGGQSLGKNIIVEPGAGNDPTVKIKMANSVWERGRVKRHGNPEVFIDPTYSINIPLFRDDKCFVLQFGLDKPPLNTLSIEYITTLKNLQVFAQKELNRAWMDAEKEMSSFPGLDETKILLDIHDLRGAVTKTQGSLELMMSLLNSQQMTEENSQLLRKIAQIALNGVEQEKLLIEQALDSAVEPEILLFDNTLTQALESVGKWLDSKDVKDTLQREKKTVHITVENKLANKEITIISKAWMLKKLLIGALENGIKHIPENGNLNILISAKQLDASDKNFLEVTIANDDGGALEDTIIKLNDPTTQKVDSDTNTSGMFLAFVAREMRKLGKHYNYPLPIEFKNSDSAGSQGFTIILRLPILDHESSSVSE